MKPLGSPKTNTITNAMSQCIDEGHHFNKWGHWKPPKAGTTIDTAAKAIILISGAIGTPESQKYIGIIENQNQSVPVSARLPGRQLAIARVHLSASAKRTMFCIRFNKWGHRNSRKPAPRLIHILGQSY